MDFAKRRSLLAVAGCAAASLLAGQARAGKPQVGSPPLPEASPPAAPPTIVLQARKASFRLAEDAPPVDMLSYDGTAAGPVLRIRQGESLDVGLSNRLDEATSLLWHGMRCPNALDGAVGLTGPALAPGANARVRFTPQDSGLYWFHPSVVPGLSDQTGRGLRGVLIVEEPQPPHADLDHLLSLADWMPASGGPLVFTVNGKAAPERITLVPGARLRLRLLNVSTARLMAVAIESARPLLLAIDGQPCNLFEPMRDTVPIGPGARFEFMVDMPREAGATVQVKLRGTERTAGALEPDRLLLELTTAGPPRPALPPIAALPPNPHLPPVIPLEQSVRANLVMEPMSGEPKPGQARWTLNGVGALALPARPLLSVRKGGTVTLGLTNKGPVPIPFRLHGHVMRLLHSKDDGWEPYWRDSILLPPQTVHHVAFVADNPGKWLLESAAFAQAAFGLRSWFLVEG